MSIRIQGQKATASGVVVQTRKVETKNNDEIVNSIFRSTLTDISKEAHFDRLMEVKSDIDKQGESLVDRVDVREFEEYRNKKDGHLS
ncbi:MAG: YaaR family protein [Oscillospiraceae bacterium]|nr:YaaR family protein [Oscillospiraceae bacterium]